MEIIYKLREDFKSYFESFMEQVASKINNELVTKIIVTAGPYRPYGCSVGWVDPFTGVINIDFYSALRMGFGKLSVDEVANGINNNEIDEMASELAGNVYTGNISDDFNEKHKDAFRRYCEMQVTGKYNMVTECEKVCMEIGLTLLEYLIILNKYEKLDKAFPEVNRKITSEYIESIK